MVNVLSPIIIISLKSLSLNKSVGELSSEGSVVATVYICRLQTTAAEGLNLRFLHTSVKKILIY